MALHLARRKQRLPSNPSLIQLFSTSSSDPPPQDGNSSGENPSQSPSSSSPPQFSYASYFGDVNDSLKRNPQQQQQIGDKPFTRSDAKTRIPASFTFSGNQSGGASTSTLELKKNLAEYGRESGNPPPSQSQPPISVQELYKRDASESGDSSADMSFEAIRESLMRMMPGNLSFDSPVLPVSPVEQTEMSRPHVDSVDPVVALQKLSKKVPAKTAKSGRAPVQSRVARSPSPAAIGEAVAELSAKKFMKKKKANSPDPGQGPSAAQETSISNNLLPNTSMLTYAERIISELFSLYSEVDSSVNESLRYARDAEEKLLQTCDRLQHVKRVAMNAETASYIWESEYKATKKCLAEAQGEAEKANKRVAFYDQELAQSSAQLQTVKVELEERNTKIRSLSKEIEDLKRENNFIRLKTQVLTRGKMLIEYQSGAHKKWDIEQELKAYKAIKDIMRERGEDVADDETEEVIDGTDPAAPKEAIAESSKRDEETVASIPPNPVVLEEPEGSEKLFTP